MTTKKRPEKIDKDVAKVFGEDFAKKISEPHEERTWCCWVLSESELIRAVKEVGIPENFGLAVSNENREAFIEEIARRFKDALSMMAEEWENELRGCVNDTVEDWKENK